MAKKASTKAVLIISTPSTHYYQWILNLVEAFASCNSEDVEALFPINSRLVDRERDKPCLD